MFQYRFKGRSLKTLIRISFIVFSSFSLHTSAQAWLWGSEATPKSPGAIGDVYFDHSVASDNSGNAYETGYFTNSLSFGPNNLNSSSINVFVAKYDSTGIALWAKQAITASSASYGYGHSVAPDRSGNIYVTGSFEDTLTFGTFPLNTPPGLTNAFLVKYDNSGNALWARQSGLTTGFAYSYSVAVDALGDAYITGIFWGTISFGAFTISSNATFGDVFLAKYDVNGNALWAKQGGVANTGSYSWGNSVAIDASGNSYITGQFLNTLYFGSYTLISASYDVFLVKYDINGNVLWATQGVAANSLSYGNGYSVTTDAPGNVYVTGQFSHTLSLGSFTLQSPKTIHGDTTDVFLAKYDKNGSVLWVDQGNILDGNAWRGYSVTSDTLKRGGGYMTIRGNSAGYVPFSLNIGTDTFNLSTTHKSSTIILQYDSAGNILCGNIFSTSMAGIGYSGDSVRIKADGSSVGVDHSGKHIYTAGYVDTTSVFGGDTLPDSGDNLPFIARWKGGCCTVVPAIKGSATVCQGDSVKLTAIGGGTYMWNNGETTSSIIVSPASSTTYSVNVSNGTCSKSTSMKISVIPYPIPVISATQTICPGSSVSITASGGTNYSWAPITGLTCIYCSSISVSPASTTEYTVTVANGPCKVKDSAGVIVQPAVSGNVCCNSAIELGGDTLLSVTGASAGSTYTWTPITGLSCNTCPDPTASPTVTTTYYITVTDTEGCSITEDVTINVNENCFFVPNAFSPNGDNENDMECVYGDCIKTMDFKIFDRWGNMVFEATDPKQCWDGRYNGEMMNSGVFIYYLRAVLIDNSIITKKGNVTLVR